VWNSTDHILQATGTLSQAFANMQPISTIPTPACSINPSDCEALSTASLISISEYTASASRAASTLFLAPSATALTIVHNGSSSAISFGSTAMTPPPIITLLGMAWSGQTDPDQPDRTIYQFVDQFGEDTLTDGSSATVTPSVPDLYLDQPLCSMPVTAAACGACTIQGGQVSRQWLHVKPSTLTSRHRLSCFTFPLLRTRRETFAPPPMALAQRVLSARPPRPTCQQPLQEFLVTSFVRR
jgi:hypothetical protein